MTITDFEKLLRRNAGELRIDPERLTYTVDHASATVRVTFVGSTLEQRNRLSWSLFENTTAGILVEVIA